MPHPRTKEIERLIRDGRALARGDVHADAVLDLLIDLMVILVAERTETMPHQPIEEEQRITMTDIGRMLAEAIGEGYGFMFLVFKKNTTEGRMNYISNADRADMLIALKELIANMEGRGPDSGTETSQEKQ